MDSLAGYESEEDNKDHTAVMNVKSEIINDGLDTNYDDVEMDESDEETNNNIVNEPDGTEIVNIVSPQDAPLVFRSSNQMNQMRDEVRCSSLDRRNSSDMEMDDNESEEEKEVKEEHVDDYTNVPIAEEQSDEHSDEPSERDALPTSTTKASTNQPLEAIIAPSDCSRRKSDSASDSNSEEGEGRYSKSWRNSIRTKRNDLGTDSSNREKPTHNRYPTGHKRAHSPERSSPSRASHHRTSRSPGRPWKSIRLEKKAAALTKMGIELRSDETDSRPLMGQQLRSQIKEVEAKTGVTLPSYYNPNIMNPLKYAQQIQKRKLLWGKKGNEAKPKEAVNSSSSSPWNTTTFKGDNDGKMTEKFKRLMGMRVEPAATTAEVPAAKSDQNEQINKQEEMFSNMEAQYQVARMVTHTYRGYGLGYSSCPSRPPSMQKNS